MPNKATSVSGFCPIKYKYVIICTKIKALKDFDPENQNNNKSWMKKRLCYLFQPRLAVSCVPAHFHFCNKDSVTAHVVRLPAIRPEGLKVRPGAVGSVCDGSPTLVVSSLSPGEEEGRPPPSSAALTAPSRHEIKSKDGRRSSSSSGGGRWCSAAGMARGGAGSKT